MALKYMSIYTHLKNSILNGKYSEGVKIPSSRVLADQLNVSRNTILEAFSHLETEGYIQSKKGSGVFVKKIRIDQTKNLKTKKTSGSFLGNYQEKKIMVAPFLPGAPDISLFPFEILARLSNKYYREVLRDNFHYEDSLGYLPLRKAISEYLLLKRQVHCNENQVMIVNGSQEAIYLSAKTLGKKGTRVYMEDPSYYLAASIFKDNGFIINPIGVDEEGMRIDKIIPEENSLIYVTPSHQFPLGYTMSIQRRLELLKLARDFNLKILEDDYDSDFRYSGEPIASLQGISQGPEVIYIGTFSKTMFPALRIGFCILPEGLQEDFIVQRKLINRQPAIVNQAIVARFMEAGYYYRHLKKMHQVYRERRNYLKAQLVKNFKDDFNIGNSDLGMHITVFFKYKINKKDILRQAEQRGIKLVFLSDYSRDPLFEPEGLVLGFSNYNKLEMQNALKILREVLNQSN